MRILFNNKKQKKGKIEKEKQCKLSLQNIIIIKTINKWVCKDREFACEEKQQNLDIIFFIYLNWTKNNTITKAFNFNFCIHKIGLKVFK